MEVCWPLAHGQISHGLRFKLFSVNSNLWFGMGAAVSFSWFVSDWFLILLQLLRRLLRSAFAHLASLKWADVPRNLFLQTFVENILVTGVFYTSYPRVQFIAITLWLWKWKSAETALEYLRLWKYVCRRRIASRRNQVSFCGRLSRRTGYGRLVFLLSCIVLWFVMKPSPWWIMVLCLSANHENEIFSLEPWSPLMWARAGSNCAPVFVVFFWFMVHTHFHLSYSFVFYSRRPHSGSSFVDDSALLQHSFAKDHVRELIIF